MGTAVKKEWFYLTLGHRRGPVTFEDFCEKIVKQEVYIDSTQVWKKGMKQWINLAEAKPFAATIKKVKSVASQSEAQVRELAATKDGDEDLACRGSSRALFNVYFYIGWVIPVTLAIAILTELQVQQILSPLRASTSLFIQILPLMVLAIATWQMAGSRMQHAGYSKWHALGVFVPLYNLWVYMICLLAPRNYRLRKNLGAGGIFYILLFGAVTASSVVYLVPQIGLKNLSPLVMTEQMMQLYKEKTGFSSRFNSHQDEAAGSKVLQEQIIEQKQSKP